MSTLMIIGLVLAGLLNAAFLALGILSFLKAKLLDEKVDKLTAKLVSNDMLKGGMTDAASDRLAQRMEMEGALHACHQDAEKQAQARHDTQMAEMAAVKGHMSQYSAVLESQNRLVAAVSGLTEELDGGGRRHR